MRNLLSPEFHSSDVRMVEAYFELVYIGCFKLVNGTEHLWNQNKFISDHFFLTNEGSN